MGETETEQGLQAVRERNRIRSEARQALILKKYRARQKANKAHKAGRLQAQPCEVCGSLEVEKHHDDYDKPLEVRWLCKTHHARITTETSPRYRRWWP